MNERDLKIYAADLFDKTGITTADRFDGCPSGSHPRDLLPDCRSLVVFCVKHLDVFSRSQNKDCQAYSQDLTKHMMMHGIYRLSRYLEKNGYKAFPVSGSYRMFPLKGTENSDGRISLRHAAQLSGVGYISRIGIVVTEEFGPAVQLGAILTDAPLQPDAPAANDPCIGCNLCIKICPSGAIEMPAAGEAYRPVNREKCLGYRRVEGGSSPMGYKNQCALCRSVCPVGKKRRNRQP